MLGSFALDISNVLNVHVLQRAAERRGHGDGQSRRRQANPRVAVASEAGARRIPSPSSTSGGGLTGATPEPSAHVNMHDDRGVNNEVNTPNPEASGYPDPEHDTHENDEGDTENTNLMQGDMAIVVPPQGVVDGVQNQFQMPLQRALLIPSSRTLGSTKIDCLAESSYETKGEEELRK